MSDLAPFVAVAIRDRVVQGLMEEINELKKKQEKRFMFQITGRNGTPIYHEKLLTDGHYSYFFSVVDNSHVTSIVWEVDLMSNDEIGLPWKTFKEGVEFRLGGVVLINDASDIISKLCNPTEKNHVVELVDGPIQGIYWRLKPGNRNDDYETNGSGLSDEETLSSRNIIFQNVVFHVPSVAHLLNKGIDEDVNTESGEDTSTEIE